VSPATRLRATLTAGMLACAAAARPCLGQELDLLEGDDYLDPRFLLAAKEWRGTDRYVTGWFRIGGAGNYQQRTEFNTYRGYAGTAALEYYKRFFQATAKAQVVSDGWSLSDPAVGLFRARAAAAVYFLIDTAPESYPARVRASYLAEQRGNGEIERGFSIDEDFAIELVPGTRPGSSGLSFVVFPDRGERTLLYFARYPITSTSDLFELNWGFQYGHTWFEGDHPGVSHNALRFELQGLLSIPTGPGFTHLRAVYSPVVFFGPRTRHGLMFLGSFPLGKVLGIDRRKPITR
jgi:hypothetical protein